MPTNKQIIIIFCILTPLLFLLVSYKAALQVSISDEQQSTVDFLQNKDVELPYTALEISHLEDVKGVMLGANVILYLLVCILAYILVKSKAKLREKLLLYAGRTTVISLLLLFLITVIGFNSLFTLFHKVFFPRGNWQFPSDSLLLQTFPLDFFLNITQFIFASTLLLGIILIIISIVLKRDKIKEYLKR